MNNQKDQRAQNGLNFKNGPASQNFCGKVPSYRVLKEIMDQENKQEPDLLAIKLAMKRIGMSPDVVISQHCPGFVSVTGSLHIPTVWKTAGGSGDPPSWVTRAVIDIAKVMLSNAWKPTGGRGDGHATPPAPNPSRG